MCELNWVVKKSYFVNLFDDDDGVRWNIVANAYNVDNCLSFTTKDNLFIISCKDDGDGTRWINFNKKN